MYEEHLVDNNYHLWYHNC